MPPLRIPVPLGQMAVLGAAAALFLTPTAVAGTEVDVGLTLASGYESNPLQLSVDGPGGGFTEVRLDSGIDIALGGRVELFLEGEGRKRLYESELSHGDYHRAGLRAGLSITPMRMGRARLSVALGGIHRIHRSTFTDRLTGNIYEVPTAPPTVPATTTLIPDRFDSSTTGAFLDLELRSNRKFRFFLQARLENADYVEDYTETTTLEALDYRSTIVEPGFSYRFNRMLSVQASLGVTDLVFRARPALDESGSEVPGTQREYQYARYRLRMRLSPARQWRVSLGFNSTDREDAFAGYYDFTAWTSFVSMDRKVGDKTRFQAYASTAKLHYDTAVIPGNPNGEIRGSEVLMFLGRFDRKLREHLSLFVEGGVQRTDNRDPVFAYDRDWVLAGIQIRR